MKRRLLVLLAALATATAAAHTGIESTQPADGAVLSDAPDELVLAFNEPVRLTAVTVRASDGIEHTVEALPGGFSARFVVEAPELSPGRYDVEWRALSEDTHVVEGTFAFTIEAGALE